MDPISIPVAFAFGFVAAHVGLPPLVGFLCAGFALYGLGVEAGAAIETIADLGVMLLLFCIGLKLRLQSLLKPEVWGGASVHMLVTVALFGVVMWGLAAAGVGYFAGLEVPTAFLIAFALSFSSTVFAVKVLEEKGEMTALHGRTAIGVLIVQDLIAVTFLAISAGKIPSPWALLLPLLLLARPVLYAALERSGHGELLILYGFFLALAGSELFDLVGVKGDLGALSLGVLMAGHPKASELAKALFGFKEIFLVGFFLTIGLGGPPDLAAFGVAVLLVALVPFKVGLFFLLFTRCRLRARTSVLASFSLANYSEFGLIVGGLAVKEGWLTAEWLVIIAVALSLTFMLASPLNASAHTLYARYQGRLGRYESEGHHPDDAPIDIGADTEIAVFGMGRVGTGAYEALRARYGDVVVGIDADPEVVTAQAAMGRSVLHGDATDTDFWARVRKNGKVRLVLLTMPEQRANLQAAEQLRDFGYPGRVAATARFADDAAALEEAGIHAVFNFYDEAGAGFAAHAMRDLERAGGAR